MDCGAAPGGQGRAGESPPELSLDALLKPARARNADTTKRRQLRRVFTLCDRDRDGALSDAELNDFQVYFSLFSALANSLLTSLSLFRSGKLAVDLALSSLFLFAQSPFPPNDTNT